jgi:hypothetical protein
MKEGRKEGNAKPVLGLGAAGLNGWSLAIKEFSWNSVCQHKIHVTNALKCLHAMRNQKMGKESKSSSSL